MNFFQRIQKRNRDFSIEIDGEIILVQVKENDRAKRLTLRILPGNGGLRVSTPAYIGDDEIKAFVTRNHDWAASRLAQMPGQLEIRDGSEILFKGLPTTVIAKPDLNGAVRYFDRETPEIQVPGSKKALPRKLLAWLKREARKELDKAVNLHSTRLSVRAKRIRITDTTSRWGSCSSTRTLSFSWRIILAPPEVLNYLAVHEVAHLREMNHSHRFWALVKDLCPDYEDHKSWLRVHGAELHALKFKTL